MKRRIMVALLCLMMLVSIVAAPFSATAEVAKILKINKNANLRNPSDYNDVLGYLKKGTKVLWTGKTKKAFYLVTTTSGKTGYIFRDYLSEYGAVNKNQIYMTKSSAKVYKRPSTSSKCVAKLGSKKYVLVYTTQNGWAYVKTTSGKGGYMKTSALRKY